LPGRAANVTLDLIDRAAATPQAPALRSAGGQMTYRELDGLTWRSARLLHDQGVRAGDVVALVFVAEVALAVAILAVARLGAAGFSLSRRSSARERTALALQAGARWLVSDRLADFDSGVPGITLDLRQAASGPGKVRAALLDERPQVPWQIIRGSGSTGVPRLIPVSHAQARSRFDAQVEAAGITPEDGLAGLSGLEFATAKHRLGWAMAAGAAFVILEEKASPLDLLAPLGVTALGASVFHAERMLLPESRVDFSKLDCLTSLSVSGSLVSADLRSRLRVGIGDRLCVTYGSNEGGHLTLATAPDVFDTPNTVGRPVATVELAVVDPEDRAVPIGMTGRVRVRGPGVVGGYWNDPDAARANFRNGWFYPGDLGRLTADGQLVHLGRADQVMIFDGINIDPAEIESVMAAHPAVRDVAAMPWRSALHQDIPVCAVTLREGGVTSGQELLQYARERLGRHGPVAVIILGRIPRNEAGKLLKADLAELLRHRLG
jgi:acyl-coenzyme A synthetase/AMP-(fatty) acid ligase